MLRSQWCAALLSLVALLGAHRVRSQSVAELDAFWYRWTNECELNCHINTWYDISCSTPNACAGDDGCLYLGDGCLCRTAPWQVAIYQCIGRKCGSDAVYDAAALSLTGCEAHDAPMAYSEQQLVDIGLAANSTNSTISATILTASLSTSSYTQTATSPPSSSTSSNDTPNAPSSGPANDNVGDPGLTNQQQIMIGIAVPVGLAFLGLIVKILEILYKRRRDLKAKSALYQGLVPSTGTTVPLLNGNNTQNTAVNIMFTAGPYLTPNASHSALTVSSGANGSTVHEMDSPSISSHYG